ncbi:hypothetical protein, partial [uncultured Ruminococcus sp.]|uniref:hypothetical protein n=1 Tax=uncultured Ruminococcus sp. TaxID=165186 RepID=UPI002665E759
QCVALTEGLLVKALPLRKRFQPKPFHRLTAVPLPQREGDRRQAVVGFPQHILKKRFTNSPKYDILYKNLSSQAYTSVFSANFAAYCVKNTCRATKKHRSQERIHQEAIF